MYIFHVARFRTETKASQAEFARIRDATRMDLFEYKLKSTGFSPGFRHNVNTKAERTAGFTNDKTRTARALARAYLVTLGEYININYLIS